MKIFLILFIIFQISFQTTLNNTSLYAGWQFEHNYSNIINKNR